MTSLARVSRAAVTIILLSVSVSSSSPQRVTKPGAATGTVRTATGTVGAATGAVGAATGAVGSKQTPAVRPSYIKAFVIDDRLSPLRRKPGLQAEVIRRLRLGHTVFIIAAARPKAGEPMFCRVAVTRRTRGWIHQAALAVQARTGEDERIMTLIEGNDGADKITLCRILNDRFVKSRLVPRAMLLLGEEAERVAETLSQRTRRRLAEVRGAVAGVRDYYLSDAGLDRYSKLGVVFDFNQSTGDFVYDGKAYREVVRRFPGSEEATLARQRLELTSQKITPSR